jgi:hypothetical protein
MKTKFYTTSVFLLGVFLMIDTSLLAQSTGTRSSREAERAREARTARAVVITPEVEEVEMFEFDHQYAYTTGSSDRNSKLTLSKRYSGHTANKKGTFEIEEGVRKIRLSIHGSVNVGEIEIKLYTPEQELKRLTIDDSADVSWSQSINIEEGETKYYGEWTYIIDARQVEGSYSLSISTY